MTIHGIDVTTLINYVFASALFPYILNWLRHHAAAAKADAADTNISVKQKLIDKFEAFLEDTTADLAEQKLPELASKINSGELATSEQVKAEFASWLVALKSDALAHFDGQSINMVKSLGDVAINKLISDAAGKITPAPGSEIEKIVKPVLDEIITGVSSEHCKACVPPCDTCPLKNTTAAKVFQK
jgi:hypothetical protein